MKLSHYQIRRLVRIAKETDYPLRKTKRGTYYNRDLTFLHHWADVKRMAESGEITMPGTRA